jgi:hypothetical protein
MDACQFETLQGIYSERDPYIEEVRLDTAGKVIFDPIFINLVRKGFSTDCISDMSEDEQQFLFEFIDYQDGTYTDKYVIALDQWLMNIINCVPNPTINGCAGTSVTFTDCSGTSITV